MPCSDRGSLQSFRERGELVLVGERNLDFPGCDLDGGAGDSLERISNPTRKSGIHCLPPPGPLLRSRPAGGLLRSADRQPSAHDELGKLTAALDARHGKHCAGMPFGELAALDHAEHVIGKIEQPEPVRDGRLRTPDSLGDVAEAEHELVEQDGVRASLLDR